MRAACLGVGWLGDWLVGCGLVVVCGVGGCAWCWLCVVLVVRGGCGLGGGEERRGPPSPTRQRARASAIRAAGAAIAARRSTAAAVAALFSSLPLLSKAGHLDADHAARAVCRLSKRLRERRQGNRPPHFPPPFFLRGSNLSLNRRCGRGSAFARLRGSTYEGSGARIKARRGPVLARKCGTKGRVLLDPQRKRERGMVPSL